MPPRKRIKKVVSGDAVASASLGPAQPQDGEGDTGATASAVTVATRLLKQFMLKQPKEYEPCDETDLAQFEDPEYCSSSQEGANSDDGGGDDALFAALDTYFGYDGKSITETLSDIETSVAGTNKILERIAVALEAIAVKHN